MVPITPQAVRRLVHIKTPGVLGGITFDRTGRSGHRYLVTITAAGKTTVDAIGCHGKITTVTRNAPLVEAVSR